MASGPQVTIHFKAVDEGAAAMWAKLVQQGSLAGVNIGKLAVNFKQAKEASRGLFETGSVGRFAAAVSGVNLSIEGMVATLRKGFAEWEKFEAARRAAGQTITDVTRYRRDMLANLMREDRTISDEAATRWATQTALETGAPLGAAFAAGASAVSARTNQTDVQSLKTARAGLKLRPDLLPGDQEYLTGGAQDMQGTFGGTPEGAMGFNVASAGFARTTHLAEYSRNIVPGIKSLALMGEDARDAASFIGALSRASADVSGRRSRTAAIRFGIQTVAATQHIGELEGQGVMERVEWLHKPGQEQERIKQGMLRQFHEPMSKDALEQLDKLGLVDEAAEDVRRMTTEAPQMMPLITMLKDPNSQMWKDVLEGRKTLPQYGSPQAEEYYRRMTTRNDPQEQAAQLEAKGKASVEVSNFNDAQAAIVQTTIDKTRELLARPSGGFEGWARSKAYELNRWTRGWFEEEEDTSKRFLTEMMMTARLAGRDATTPEERMRQFGTADAIKGFLDQKTHEERTRGIEPETFLPLTAGDIKRDATREDYAKGLGAVQVETNRQLAELNKRLAAFSQQTLAESNNPRKLSTEVPAAPGADAPAKLPVEQLNRRPATPQPVVGGGAFWGL